MANIRVEMRFFVNDVERVTEIASGTVTTPLTDTDIRNVWQVWNDLLFKFAAKVLKLA